VETARIAELLKPFFAAPYSERLGDGDLAAISSYIDLLLRWNARINLTAIRDSEKIVTRHFGESFFLARHLFPGGGEPTASAAATASPASVSQFRLADVGSGAGFPGIPIKLWAREISLTLIESNQKKMVFLREVCRALRLRDVNVQNERVEKAVAPAFDAVTLRAVERFGDVLPAAGNLVGRDGRLALLISSVQVATAKSKLAGFRWEHPIPIPMSELRRLLIGTKESE
jgi:16S rRNA (guanine527-N7)-methyltransferase